MSLGASGAAVSSCKQCGAMRSAAHEFCSQCGTALAAWRPTIDEVRHRRLSVGSQENVLASELHLVVRRTFLEIEEAGDVEPPARQRRFTDSFLSTKDLLDVSNCSTCTSEGTAPSLPSTPSTPRSSVERPPQPQEPMLWLFPAPCIFGPVPHQWWEPWGTQAIDPKYGQQGLGHKHTSRIEKSKGMRSKGAAYAKRNLRTTVMLRNLPLEYTREMFVELLNAEGFFGLYDFVYVPIDFSTKSGLGYAFVNMVSAVDAECFWKHFDGFSDWAVESGKLGILDWSTQQGLAAHIERYRNSPVMHASVADECRPLLFRNGVRVAFPPPSKPIKGPRLRGGN